ncbi:MAG: hypothetical protein GQ574_16565 [Crocinitomix sp.]|nr:hypothetical protein [Crocinitomix sp.]
MKKLSIYFYRKSTLALALIATALMIAYFAFVFMPAGKCFEVESGTIALGLSFGLPLELVQDFFAVRTVDMIECYIKFNTIWDNIFPLLYGLIYAIWISLIFKPISSKLKLLNLLPFAQTVLDWAENISLVNIANSVLAGDEISSSAVQVASLFSVAKWTVAGLVFITIGIGVLLRIIWAITGKKQN